MGVETKNPIKREELEAYRKTLKPANKKSIVN